MTTTFETAKVGDQLWSVEFGWGEVVSIDIVSKCFTVEFSSDEFETYCSKGARKRPIREKMQTLFWDEVEFKTPKKPMPVLQVDTKVLVWDNSREHARNAHFCCFEDGKIYTYMSGRTSFTKVLGDHLDGWNYWELAE